MWREDDRLMGLFASLGAGGSAFPRACPACGERGAHVLMHRLDLSGSRGTVWAWCDACRGYAHFGAVVPAWWTNPGFVDEERLDSYVDYPASIGGLIDGWIDSLLDGVRGEMG